MKYFRVSLLVGLSVMLLGLIIWTDQQGQPNQTVLAEIQARNILRVGLDASLPPFEFLDETGQVVGLDADIAHAIAADLGVEVVFVNIGFDGLYDALKIGRVDILVSGLPVEPMLTQDVAYSINYFNAGQVLVTRLATVQQIEDLAGQTIAVEWGSMADLVARRLHETIPNLEIVPQPDTAKVLQADIAIVDAVTALQFKSQQETSALRIVTYLTDEWYAAAVKREHRPLLMEINKTLTRLREQGTPPCHLAVPQTGIDYRGKLRLCYEC